MCVVVGEAVDPLDHAERAPRRVQVDDPHTITVDRHQDAAPVRPGHGEPVDAHALEADLGDGAGVIGQGERSAGRTRRPLDVP